MGLYLDIAKQVEASRPGGPQGESTAVVQWPAFCLPPPVPPPCAHARTDVRADGIRVCFSCGAVYINGVWSPQTITYCATAHIPYDPTPIEGPLRQCQDCPHVWQMPWGCGAVSWQSDWSGMQPVWSCRRCGACYGTDEAQSQGQHTKVDLLSTCAEDLETPAGAWHLWERPGACHACGTTRRWRSIYGAVVCARCHPPADTVLVATWQGEER